MGEQPTLLPDPPAPDVPPMSAADALRHVDVMIACMDMWQGKKGDTAEFMRGWARWLRGARPHLEAAAARSNEEPPHA